MIEREGTIRLAVFLAFLAVMALWEVVRPRRMLSRPRAERWRVNLLLTVLDIAFVRVTLGAVAVQTALYAEARGWGLLHVREVSPAFAFLVTVVLLDMALYLQHVMSHALPVFWRLHRVHHSDLDFDVTTGLRFHPFEIFLSMVYKAGVVAALGASPWGVVVFEIILNAASQFNHGNVAIPSPVDRMLRRFVVTPDMHRVHHSWKVKETNSNFGFFLPWWDRLFGTYRDQPEDGHRGMTIGLKEYREPQGLSLLGLVLLPFRGSMGGYSFRRD